ncbi:MAG: glutamate racemase, partial [Idiomarina sp. 34-48-12]
GPILEETMRHYFSDLVAPDVVLLGCTHFPLIADQISQFWGGVKTIHSGEAMVSWLRDKLELEAKFAQTPIRILASENVAAVKRTAEHWGLGLA